MDVENLKALYSIGIVAEILSVHPRTLRIYEQEGLIRPARRGGKRFYSNNDLQWLKCLRKLLTVDGLNIAGVKKLLTLTPCWNIRGCPEDVPQTVSRDLELPRALLGLGAQELHRYRSHLFRMPGVSQEDESCDEGRVAGNKRTRA